MYYYYIVAGGPHHASAPVVGRTDRYVAPRPTPEYTDTEGTDCTQWPRSDIGLKVHPETYCPVLQPTNIAFLPRNYSWTLYLAVVLVYV